MTGIDSWSTTPATNATADGGSINWAEGQPPSSVNNTARQMCADIRAMANDLAWFQYGTGNQGAGNLAVPAVYASATTFTIAGVDVTSIYTANRRVRAVGVSTGTIYGTISGSVFGANTTVTVVWDSGSLSNETLVVSLSQIPVTGKPVRVDGISGVEASTYTPTITNVTNVSASTAYASQYMRVGSVVTVSGKVDIDTTSASVSTEIGISLPIASNFASSQQASGTAVQGGQAGLCASVNGDSTNDRASLFFVNSIDVQNRSWTYQFTYLIV